MLRPRLAHLQLRLQQIESLIGPSQQYKDKQILQAREKIQQLIGKSHKEVQRKFQKIKRGLNNYGTSLNILPSQDKINIVTQQLEELREVSKELDQIEKLIKLHVLKNDQLYLKIRKMYGNMELLLSASEIQERAEGGVKVKEYRKMPMAKVRHRHREEMNCLFELNNRIIGNLNNQLKLLHAKETSSTNS